jgi:ribosomal protein S27AE
MLNCRVCRGIKPASAFTLDGAVLRTACKSCENLRKRSGPRPKARYETMLGNSIVTAEQALPSTKREHPDLWQLICGLCGNTRDMWLTDDAADRLTLILKARGGRCARCGGWLMFEHTSKTLGEYELRELAA